MRCSGSFFVLRLGLSHHGPRSFNRIHRVVIVLEDRVLHEVVLRDAFVAHRTVVPVGLSIASGHSRAAWNDMTFIPTTDLISPPLCKSMVHLCLGWEVSSIQEKLVFETDGAYDDPDPEKYSEVINQWWVDLFRYLAEFKCLDVFACSGNMHFFDDDEVRIIGIPVEFGWVLSHNSYDPDDHGVRSEHQDFTSLQAFINDQHSKSNPIPPPKVHISEWYEHGFIHLETQVSMLLEDRQKREERQKRWEEIY